MTQDNVAIPWSSYQEMVQSLWKFMPGHGADLLHAAIGLVGEVGELFDASDRENFVEECSDLEFYFEASWQALARIVSFTNMRDTVEGTFHRTGSVLVDLSIACADLLDLAKKQWAYNQTIEPAILITAVVRAERVYITVLDLYGIDRIAVRHANMTKLAKRYGKDYSDKAAQARADKA